MCSATILHTTKSTIKQKKVHGRFSAAFATEAEFLIYFSSIEHPETCCTLIGVNELSALLRKTPGTLAGYVSQYPERLPPRFFPPGESRAAMWRIKDYFSWSEAAAAAPAAPPAPSPSPPPAAREKRRPGRPTNASSRSNT